MKHTTTNKDNRSAVAANVRAELVAPITLEREEAPRTGVRGALRAARGDG